MMLIAYAATQENVNSVLRGKLYYASRFLKICTLCLNNYPCKELELILKHLCIVKYISKYFLHSFIYKCVKISQSKSSSVNE